MEDRFYLNKAWQYVSCSGLITAFCGLGLMSARRNGGERGKWYFSVDFFMCHCSKLCLDRQCLDVFLLPYWANCCCSPWVWVLPAPFCLQRLLTLLKTITEMLSGSSACWLDHKWCLAQGTFSILSLLPCGAQ